jgi:putative hydrolase of the HAD superfamily
MIKAIIFDVGGVLLRTEDHSFRRRWEAELGLEPGEAEEIVFNSEMGLKAQRGEISDEELWRWIGSRLELGLRLEAFRQDFWAGDVLDENMVTLIRSLRPHYQTAVISNATDALHDSLDRKFGIADAFDVIIGSADIGIMKPSPAIYERALADLDREAQESVFIDDFQHNVAAARALGMSVVHFRPGLNLAAELADLGVQIPETGGKNE